MYPLDQPRVLVMQSLRGFSRTLVVSAAVLLVACSSGDDTVVENTAELVIRGAGATFPEPLYQKWIDSYDEQTPNVAFEYAGVGSGKGIAMFLAGKDPAGEVYGGAEIDYGASDAAMSDADLEQVGERGAVMVPTTGGMVVLAYNLPGVDTLMLSREAIEGIFSGEIKHWQDERITATNPDIDFPRRAVTPVVRRDSSGTTYIITSHFAEAFPAWRDGPGVGKQIDWPGSTMAVNYNEGVAQRVNITEGGIGYMEFQFAKRLGLPMATLQNKTGGYMAPTAAAGSAALGSAPEVPEDLRVFVPDPPDADAYPIVGYTWLLLYQQYPHAEKRDALKDAVLWSLTQGQPIAEDMGYIPLPADMVRLARAKVEAIQ